MNYFNVLKTCLYIKYSSIAGRAGPYEFWYFQLTAYIFWVGSLLLWWVGSFRLLGQFSLFFSLLIFIIPCITVTVRRLHDLGRSGKWIFIIFVPLVGHLILLYWCDGPTESGLNLYGKEPWSSDPPNGGWPWGQLRHQTPVRTGVNSVKLVVLSLAVGLSGLVLSHVGKDDIKDWVSDQEAYFAEEQYTRGMQFKEGLGLDQDYGRALGHLKSAARKGSVGAQNNLGAMYYYGQGVNPNLTRSLRYFEEASALGSARAALNLGFVYYNGEGVSQDLTKAYKYFKLAHDQGIVEAQPFLNLLHQEGLGPQLDPKPVPTDQATIIKPLRGLS